ncbi:MAG: flagellar hook-basal body complex protein, partial [Gemmobacter sp.]
AGVSTQIEAFFEGSEMGIDGVHQPYSTKKIVVREIGAAAQRTAANATNPKTVFSFTDTFATGAVTALSFGSFTATTSWVDERNPPIKIAYDSSGQNLEFSTDRNVLGSAGAGFSTFTVFNNQLTSGSNGIGIPAATNRREAPIRGGEVLEAEAFVATGRELNADKRFGIKVEYDNDARAFTIASGSTGEAIGANYAVGVTAPQQASNIQIGRRAISSTDGSATANKLLENVLPTEKTIGGGTNFLMGFGTVKKENVAFVAGKGLAAKPAVAAGSSAQIPLATAFRLTSTNAENVFSISVDGVSATIVLPPRTYAGSTLASALQERINQMSDPITGKTIGGVTVRYNPTSNNLTFTTGTTGINSTIKVSGPARFGLDDVPLGIGSVPEIFDLQQAVNERGELLFVDPQGKVTTAQPDDSELVSDYYPLYIKEGELTFDKGGRLISPKNLVGYEEQLEGASITLKVDYSASTQLAQPFGVINISQDGFTAGRLDGLEIDSSGTIRANYTNGDNNPLGKIVIANFNNQNGLKQVGNATYVETAISGPPTVGEAGAEGFGTILSGSLERSNVDITEELVNLITAQRNYQASAKAIETTTSLNQTIINIRQ